MMRFMRSAMMGSKSARWQTTSSVLHLPATGRALTCSRLMPATACRRAATAPPSHQPFGGTYPLQAVCTTGMVADLVRRVGGEQVAVTQLMGEGVDPHLYKPSTGDLSTLNRADVIFYSGLHLEGK